MAAGVAAVPLPEIAHEDGTPRFAFMQQANRSFDETEARNAGNSRLRSESRTAFHGMLTTLEDELRRRAEAESSEVMITMGRRSREEGRDDEAADWYRRAAESGEPEGT